MSELDGWLSKWSGIAALKELVAAINRERSRLLTLRPPIGSMDQDDLGKVREAYPRAHAVWKAGEDQRLITLQSEGKSPEEIGKILGRSPTAVFARLLTFGPCWARCGEPR